MGDLGSRTSGMAETEAEKQEKEEGEVELEDLGPSPHYLHTKWVLWFDGALQSGKRSGANDWAKNMKRVGDFDTVEDFWGVINNIPPPSKLPVGCNYHLFREGIMPMWEDANNSMGGKWTYNEKRSAGMSTKAIDSMWLYAMLSLIGETYPDTNQICGGVCSLRQKQDRVAVWTRDAQDADCYTVIGKIFRQALNDALGPGKPINDRDWDYQPHDEALKKLGSAKGRR